MHKKQSLSNYIQKLIISLKPTSKFTVNKIKLSTHRPKFNLQINYIKFFMRRIYMLCKGHRRAS